MSLSVKTLPIEFSEKVAQKSFPKMIPIFSYRKKLFLKELLVFKKLAIIIETVKNYLIIFRFIVQLKLPPKLNKVKKS
jgi:hypothetical protein